MYYICSKLNQFIKDCHSTNIIKRTKTYVILRKNFKVQKDIEKKRLLQTSILPNLVQIINTFICKLRNFIQYT